MSPKAYGVDNPAALRRRAEERLRVEAPALPQGDSVRILHELQVHQIQLEMQNDELRDARERLEMLVEKYTDLYDFAPVGYLSLDAAGLIQAVNLPAATLLGVERSKLIRRRFAGFVAQGYHSVLEGFLRKVLESNRKHICELALDVGAKETLWVDLQATRTQLLDNSGPLCRLAVSDITARKHAMEAQRRVDALEAVNKGLKDEVGRRMLVEKNLRESRKTQTLLLEKSKKMEEELRLLSHQIMHTQEEERKRISIDLHDEIAQTLVAINVHLAALGRSVDLNTGDIAGKIVETQKMVERSVESVHRFAMGLRPTQLDDLGLVYALQGYIREFMQRTKIPVLFKVPTGFKPLGDTRSVALYRVVQSALTNVAQHANAMEVKLEIRQTQRSVCMEISDDGQSFDVKKAMNEKRVKRLGLIGMRERVEMIGGKFDIASSVAKGTTICVTLPRLKACPDKTPNPKADL